jgi:hypothetical protein
MHQRRDHVTGVGDAALVCCKFGAHGALGLGTFSEDEAEEYVDIEDSEEEGGSIEGEVVDVQRKARARPTGT